MMSLGAHSPMSIVAAIGGEHEQDRIVETGYELAEAFDDDLVVLHVMEQEKFEDIRGRHEIVPPVMVPGGDVTTGLAYASSERSLSEYNLEDASADAEGVARECLENTLAEEHRARITTVGRVGDPKTEIVDEAAQRDAQFIVVGGRKRTPVGKAIFGSVSQGVILEADRSVVSIAREQ